MSRKSATFFSAGTRLQVLGAWEALTFMLNGLVFVLIGLQLPYVLAGIRGRYGIGTLILYGAIFSAVLIALRMIWVFPSMKFASFVDRQWLGHHEKPLAVREVFVVGWTGMRGVLALAAAISVPEVLADGRPFEARNLIVFLAFCVILVTLVLQGLTLPPLIRKLGLASPTGMDREEREARRIAVGEAIAYLEEARKDQGGESSHVYDDVIDRYAHRLAAVSDVQAGEDRHSSEVFSQIHAVAEGAIQTERRAMIRLRDEGRISDDVLRTVERELDLEESRYQVVKA
jgi:monovalent cation/hydrogen antiporter